jgi:integrase
VLRRDQAFAKPPGNQNCRTGSLLCFGASGHESSAVLLVGSSIDLVFKTRSGRPIKADSLAKHFKSILEAAALPLIRLHDLRHTAATLALAAGVPVKVVSEQLGHATAASTLDTYAHVLPHMQDEAAAKVEAMLLEQASVVAA